MAPALRLSNQACKPFMGICSMGICSMGICSGILTVTYLP